MDEGGGEVGRRTLEAESCRCAMLLSSNHRFHKPEETHAGSMRAHAVASRTAPFGVPTVHLAAVLTTDVARKLRQERSASALLVL